MPLFIKRPTSPQVVEAVQLPPGAQASPTRGRPPRPGDWFITDHSSGESFAMSTDEFNVAYEPLAVPVEVLANVAQEQTPAPYLPTVIPDAPRLPGYSYQPVPTPPPDPSLQGTPEMLIPPPSTPPEEVSKSGETPPTRPEHVSEQTASGQLPEFDSSRV